MSDIERLLAIAVDAYRQLPNGIPVPVAIEAMTGFKVIPVDEENDAELLDKIIEACRNLVVLTKVKPVLSGRVNEVGNNVEPVLKACLEGVGLAVSWPSSVDGTGNRSGYPDLLITENDAKLTYIEAKVVGSGQDASSFRSFYLSPSGSPKIISDARHILIGFAHQSVGIVENSLTGYRMLGFKIVDISRVEGKIKFEYQSSNRDIYKDKSIIYKG